MQELRKNQIIQLFCKNGSKIDGIVEDYLEDRVMVKVNEASLNAASFLKELDEVDVCVHTVLGVKKMISSILTPLDYNEFLVIENTEAIAVDQKRQHVRIICTINFSLFIEDDEYNCTCVNLSSGGIAFKTEKKDLQIGEIIKLRFNETDFGSKIETSAKILKIDNEIVSCQFANLSSVDEGKITKYVFNEMVKN